MNTYTLEAAQPDTLDDVVALISDPAEAARRLTFTRTRIEAGALRPEQYLILRSPRGVEGVCLRPTNPRVPLFPQLREDVPAEALTVFLRELRAAAPRLILFSTQAPLRREEAQAAGWALQEANVVYETADLRARSYPADPHVQPVTVNDPGVAAALTALGREDWTPGEDWTLYALTHAGEVAALGALGASGRPDTAGIDLIGVLPQRRGQGFGGRLHAHLLHLAAQTFGTHVGGTEAGSHAMRRLFDRHGARLVSTQLDFSAAPIPASPAP
ncbi:GNAT family N-acetyltransferase [Deinococcus arenae]|uniref:GNAT family N-acetyltransferase n=1 Tax=Deinococcus arenae TaxID=1452751 RepID=A0A8H9GPH8_9DEIO|nr:GNAT family N-acetyltransferase [Deinococcus arenae]AWT36501.1 GNAT family N-acetyltransferase [Deinococcus actinosclerus]GGM43212.1 GNAT family N-acetyltransferase [Deinococcus arenae]